MKIKLDENLESSLALPLEQDGHDVATIPGERLSGHADSEIYVLLPWRASSHVILARSQGCSLKLCQQAADLWVEWADAEPLFQLG